MVDRLVTKSVMVVVIIKEVNPRRCTELLEEITGLEKKIFPKHESLARSLKQELKQKNSGLIYAKAASGEQGVKERYRRQGHGEALLSAAIQKCRMKKAHRVCLHVDLERIPAVSLYEKIGF